MEGQTKTETAEEVILLDYWRSPYAMRVKIALAQKNIDYKCIEQDLLGSKSDLLLESNPVHKRVPVLIHNGKPVSESMVIIQYIDEVWSHTSPLLPSDPYLRSQATFWADFVDNKIFASGKEIWQAKGEKQENIIKEFIEGLKLLEEVLKEEKYFGGEKLGYIDVALVPLTSWFYAFEKCGNFSIIESCPKLMSWAQRCQEHPSVSNSLANPAKIYDYVLDLKKMFGLE
ncbi:hypothetical protein RND81_11G186300 [Saponaria officinalis]|uniref:glutathione transferase n=1 Tax=Saponaria officinalis TaxID=3572 RepID=A0AAW1HNW1_SAPOF